MDVVTHIWHEQEPSRKQPRAGDVFVMQLDEGFLHGRVVATDARSDEYSGLDALLLYIYSGVSDAADVFPDAAFAPPSLLVPPEITNAQGWRKGFFRTVGNRPLAPDELLPAHVFRDLSRSGVWWDMHTNRVEEPAAGVPVGAKALASFLTIESRVSVALGRGRTIQYG